MALKLELPYTTHRLSNGLRVFVHEDHSLPLAAVNLWYHVGSKDERPGRTGFAHLFEHIMFEGSLNVPKGEFDELLEAVGGTNNGSTSTDRTNYWETVPSNAVELALFLEADRMGWLLDTMSQDKLDAQRDVVKNERRQSYENRPYGLAFETLSKALYPPAHPYHWPIIGWMEDLDAATLDDVIGFFRTYYTPGNATLAIAGDVDTDRVMREVEKQFGAIRPGQTVPAVITPPARLPGNVFLTLEDDVHLPRLYLAWHTPKIFEDGDAELDVASAILAHGKSSRLYRRLVYQLGIAQDVDAYQDSALLGSTFTIAVTARPGVTIDDIARHTFSVLRELAHDAPVEEVLRAVRRVETAVVGSLQCVGGFGGRADRLNHYAFYVGEPDYVAEDLARYTQTTPDAISRAVQSWLLDEPFVALTIVPRGEADRALQELRS